jgi:cystathionine beta-lyase/cystathionine gamma-synthase
MLITEHFERFSLSHTFIDPHAPESWRAALRPETRAIYTESITNPTMQVIDHERVVAFAREHGLVALIDNTFATPVNFRPLELGYDIALHSATKYLNGHSDVAAGALCGRRERVAEITHLLNELGGMLDPHACFLLNRGMKTLTLRVREQNANALSLARFLAEHPAVRHVHYPGLETHPQHALAKKLFAGYGGMLSFELRGEAAAARTFFERVTIPTVGPSLGGVETLLTRPAATSHRGLTAEARQRLGIGDGLIRVSTGIESAEDLLADFGQALDALR